jgi:hypothetical protein
MTCGSPLAAAARPNALQRARAKRSHRRQRIYHGMQLHGRERGLCKAERDARRFGSTPCAETMVAKTRRFWARRLITLSTTLAKVVARWRRRICRSRARTGDDDARSKAHDKRFGSGHYGVSGKRWRGGICHHRCVYAGKRAPEGPDVAAAHSGNREQSRVFRRANRGQIADVGEKRLFGFGSEALHVVEGRMEAPVLSNPHPRAIGEAMSFVPHSRQKK